jgi:hypothetical protein
MSYTVYLGLLVCIVRSLSIPLLLETIRYFNPNYSSATCAIKLIEKTNEVHYRSHVFYKGLTIVDDCDIERFALAQTIHNEYYYIELFYVGLFLYGAFSLLSSWKLFLSPRIVVLLVSGYLLATLQHCFLHYSQDNLFLIGIIHHADTSSLIEESSSQLLNITPEGYFVYLILTSLWAMLFRAYLTRADSILKAFFGNYALLVTNVGFSLIAIWIYKAQHNAMHQLVSADILHDGAMDVKLWTFAYQAHQHVFCHHVSGLCPGPSLLFDPIFDALLRLYAFIHNDLCNISLQEDVMLHFGLAITFDVISSGIVMCVAWVILRLCVYFYYCCAENMRHIYQRHMYKSG